MTMSCRLEWLCFDGGSLPGALAMMCRWIKSGMKLLYAIPSRTTVLNIFPPLNYKRKVRLFELLHLFELFPLSTSIPRSTKGSILPFEIFAKTVPITISAKCYDVLRFNAIFGGLDVHPSADCVVGWTTLSAGRPGPLGRRWQRGLWPLLACREWPGSDHTVCRRVYKNKL